MNPEVAAHFHLPEPRLSFHPDHRSEEHFHPLLGLLQFGPYSSGFLPDPIRVATISPSNGSQDLYRFMRELRSSYPAQERQDYLPDWPGFQSVFRVRMEAAQDLQLELDDSLDNEVQSSSDPHLVLSERLIRSIQSLVPFRTRFDVLFIYLPERWEPGFYGDSREEFDLHHHLKALAASMGIPVQFVREDRALEYPNRASVMWRIGIALYAKAGGIPWKMVESDPATAYIGISYAIKRNDTNDPSYVTCCSQIFDAEGIGLEFIAYNAHEVDIRGTNPFLSRTEMFRVISRSINLYRQRHAGQSPGRVMVHKSSQFREEEVEGAMEALHLCDEVDLLQVIQSPGWRAARLVEESTQSTKSRPADYPVQRGTVLSLTDQDALLWIHGSVTSLSPRRTHFQGARGTPQPIMLRRFAGHGSWHDTAFAALALSKMNWNNDALYDQLPVTMGYASILAEVMKGIEHLANQPYQFRFFM